MKSKALRFVIAVSCLLAGSMLPAKAQHKKIALTFDDELQPNILFSPGGLLGVLQVNRAQATFFVLGWQVKSDPELFRKMHDQGYELENHTYGHDNIAHYARKKGDDAVLVNLKKTSDLVEKITGRPTVFFRPPFWVITPALKREIESRGYRVMLIGNPDINTLDYEGYPPGKTAEALAASVMKTIGLREKRGIYSHVLVFHELRPTVGALRIILPLFAARGYRFVLLKDFFGNPEEKPRRKVASGKTVASAIAGAGLFPSTAYRYPSFAVANAFYPEGRQSRDGAKNRPVRAMYLSMESAYSERKIAEIGTIIKEGRANAVVIDYKTDAVLPKKRAEELVSRFKKLGAYVIARIVVMQDSRLAKLEPKVAIRHRDGSLWTSGRPSWRRYWVDPSAPDVLNYNLKIAEGAIDLGFDELNFDYVRFPSDGSMKDIVYPFWRGDKKSMVPAMNGFYAKLTEELRRYDHRVKLSADIFGVVAAYGREAGIGQDFAALAKYFDAVAPMAYPSHYSCGEFGFTDPAAHPYGVYAKTLQEAEARLKSTGLKTEIRPWIQAFSIPSIYGCGPAVHYGPAEIEAEIKAARDSGIDSFMLWNAGSDYLPEYFK